jgi:hypothetical protein
MKEEKQKVIEINKDTFKDFKFEVKVDVTGLPKIQCFRCNDNGCPACDGTKGSKYNPEPY